MSEAVSPGACFAFGAHASRPVSTWPFRVRYFWTGVALACVSWLLESYVHVVFFSGGNLTAELLTGEPHEIWKRGLIAVLLIVFGLHAQFGIDRLRRTEAALTVSETKYRTLIAEALNPVIVLDRTGQILEHNRAARIIFFDDDDSTLETRRYQELFSSPDPTVSEDLMAVNPGQYEVNYRGAATTKTLLLNVVPFESSDGKQLYFGIGQDFTERKRMQDTLELAHAELQQIFQTSASAMRVVDADHNVLKVNEAFVALSGIRREDAVGAKCFEILPGEKCNTQDCPIDRILDGAKEIKYELTKTRSDGRALHCLLTARPFLAAGNEPVGIVESFNDITALAEAQEELRAERDRLSVLLFQQAEGVAIIRRDYIIDYQNATIQEDFGSCVGRACYEALRGRTAPCPRCNMEAAIESRQLQRHEYERGGRFFEHAYTPFRDGNGEEKVLVVLREVTEQKASRASVIRSEQLATLGELAAGVAHEINNPMNGIINYAQMLINREREYLQVREIATKVVNEGDRVARIVESLLAFARRESHTPVATRVDELVRNSLTLVGAQIRKDAIQLSVEIPPDLPEIYCVPQELEQVFLNILSNARYALNEKYPDAHHNKRLRITADVDRANVSHDVVITFEDFGVGIPTSLLGKITRPFFSTKPKGEGTGLGLSICREIVQECGGCLSIKSVEGERTQVTVALPRMVA